jgi:hypothetical protein
MALFENMEWLDKDATGFTERGKTGAKALAARAKKLSELAGALPLVGQAFTKARSLYFSLIQNQIVCVDDLERRSKNLDLKDVLGLISFLREQRGCKVALILNAEQLGDKKEEFDTLLEKVVEEKVVFAPTSAESLAIALQGKDDPITSKFKAHCEALGIRNIRVVKQIERLVRRIDGVLTAFPKTIRDQAVHSVTLFGWSKYDREHSVKIEFLKQSSLERHLARHDQGTPQPPEEAGWESLLEKYKYGRSDDFDLALMKFVDTMILDTDEIQREARKLEEQQRIGGLQGTFGDAWRSFHDSFEDDEEAVVKDLIDGAEKSVEVVSLPNLNELVMLLKGLGRTSEANDILEYFAENRRDSDYWNSDDPFGRGPFDPDVSALIERKKVQEPEALDLADALIKAGKDYDSETIRRLAATPLREYRDLILSSRGDRLRSIVLSALEFRRVANASEDMRRVREKMEEALRMIGRRSRLNALRLKKYGVSIDDSQAESG